MSSESSTQQSSPSPVALALEESARHAALVTQPLAESAHTTLVNALSTPTVSSLHDHTPARVNVVISRPEEFTKKRKAMVEDGHEHLQIISDFDRTLSAFRTRTKVMCAASHQLLEACVHDQKTFHPKIDAINAKYFAIEVSHDITEEVRAAHMLDWWNQAHDLLLEQGIKKSEIEATVAKCRHDGSLELRAGAKELLHRLNQLDIPLLVFSAGLKVTIEVTLKQEELLLPNLHLIGNETNFNPETDLLESFGDVITSSNKNYSHVHTQQPDYHERSLTRRNVILIGDNIGDGGMSDGLTGIKNLLKIGLLHDHVDARLEQFKSVFDVVLLNDASFEFTQELVEEIIAGTVKGN